MTERYRPLFKLDSGGMAEVYVAEAESMAGFKKKVAIKRILPGLTKDERFVRMFLDEARLSLHLSHTNVVTVFDIGKSDNSYFIVMEYVDGTNLKGLLEYLGTQPNGQRMTISLVGWLLNEILKGLDYAHRLCDPETGRPFGIVHRDISPPNILLSWSGEVKLTDFGLAKATTQLESTDPGVVKGKFAYLSPEAAHGLEVDHRTDIFAVGILAYEMLTGRRLFLGETDYQTVELVRRAEIPNIRTLNPEVPEELERIILTALARTVEQRYQTANQFADDLLHFLFSRGLKVSTRDLAALIAPLRRSNAVTSQKQHSITTNLIVKLIDEELLSFRSLDQDSGEGNKSPSGDTQLAARSDTRVYDPALPLRIDDFGSMHAGSTDEADYTPLPRARGEMPSIAPAAAVGPRDRHRWPPIWLVLVAVLLAGGSAYVLFLSR